ncbi:MAG: hypothetical protein PHP82_01270 [Candidatus ainarchaeum sp.]|nr:hypothetical protein [Candidatus ainarchaeum sp.]
MRLKIICIFFLLIFFSSFVFSAPSNAKFGIFYLLWHCTSLNSQGVAQYDLSKGQLGPVPSWHWWGEPKLGYYCLSNNDNILRIHAEMLRDAGIDFVYVDMTNHPHITLFEAQKMIIKPFERMLEVWKTVPNAPKIVPWLPIPVANWNNDGDYAGNNDMINKILGYMIDSKYAGLWANFGGKKLILAVDYEYDSISWTKADDLRISAIESAMFGDSFIVRKMWAWNPIQPKWSFFEHCSDWRQFKNSGGTTTCSQRLTINGGLIEQIPVTFAYQNLCMNWDAISTPKFYGRTFRKQFETVFNNPSAIIVTIASWNEWIVQRYYSSQPAPYGRGLSENSEGFKSDCFMDAYSSEYSKDAEPANDMLGYYYYNLMKSCINIYNQGKNCSSLGMSNELCCRDISTASGSRDRFGCNNNGICESFEDTMSCPNDCPPTCTSFTYSSWSPSTCPSSGVQTRTIVSKSPTGCVGGAPVLSQPCTYVPSICTSSNWVYSDGVCRSDGLLVRTWSKVGVCVGGVSKPATEFVSCDYVSSCTSSNWVFVDGVCRSDGLLVRTWSKVGVCVGGVSKPATEFVFCDYVSSCTSSNWVFVDGNCGADGKLTRVWNKIGNCSGGISHPTSELIDCNYEIPVCSSFVYSDWGSCSNSGVQSRSILNSFPSGCVGGNFILSQSCVPTCFSFVYSDWGDCNNDGLKSRSVSSSFPSGCVGGNPILFSDCNMGECESNNDCLINQICVDEKCVLKNIEPECLTNNDCDDNEKCVREKCEILNCKSGFDIINHECVCNGVVCGIECFKGKGICCNNIWNPDLNSCEFNFDEIIREVNKSKDLESVELIQKANESINKGNVIQGQFEAKTAEIKAKIVLADNPPEMLEIYENIKLALNNNDYNEVNKLIIDVENKLEFQQQDTNSLIIPIIIFVLLSSFLIVLILKFKKII